MKKYDFLYFCATLVNKTVVTDITRGAPQYSLHNYIVEIIEAVAGGSAGGESTG